MYETGKNNKNIHFPYTAFSTSNSTHFYAFSHSSLPVPNKYVV